MKWKTKSQIAEEYIQNNPNMSNGLKERVLTIVNEIKVEQKVKGA